MSWKGIPGRGYLEGTDGNGRRTIIQKPDTEPEGLKPEGCVGEQSEVSGLSYHSSAVNEPLEALAGCYRRGIGSVMLGPVAQ